VLTDKPKEGQNKLQYFLSILNKYWRYEYFFLLIGIVFGLKLVFINPPWHTNDEDRHFYNAYSLSQGHLIPEVKDKQIGHYMPSNLIAAVTINQGVGYQFGQLINKENLKELELQQLEYNKQEFCPNVNAYIFPLAYVPAAIMIKVGMSFKDNPIWIGWWGRIGSLLAYLFIIFYAIKIIPHFKGFLMAVALSPMALFQGASVTYDTLNIALLFLLFALVIKYYFQEAPITLKQILFYFLIAFLHRCTKEGYFILYFALFAISISKFESKKLFWTSILLIISASYLPPYIWGKYIGTLNLPFPPLQNDFLFNGDLSLSAHLKDPLHLIVIGLQNIFVQGKTWLIGIVGRFGYSYTLLPDWIVFLHLSIYALLILNEKPLISINNSTKNKLLIISALNFVAIIFGTLIYISPVGATLIYGLQGRYFLPIIPFLFLSLFYIPVNKNYEPTIKWVLPFYLVGVLWYAIYFIDITFYIP
jgi:uncharacterized membrane protein